MDPGRYRIDNRAGISFIIWLIPGAILADLCNSLFLFLWIYVSHRNALESLMVIMIEPFEPNIRLKRSRVDSDGAPNYVS